MLGYGLYCMSQFQRTGRQRNPKGMKHRAIQICLSANGYPGERHHQLVYHHLQSSLGRPGVPAKCLIIFFTFYSAFSILRQIVKESIFWLTLIEYSYVFSFILENKQLKRKNLNRGFAFYK